MVAVRSWSRVGCMVPTTNVAVMRGGTAYSGVGGRGRDGKWVKECGCVGGDRGRPLGGAQVDVRARPPMPAVHGLPVLTYEHGLQRRRCKELTVLMRRFSCCCATR